MDATTVGIDLAKNVFEIALADERGHIVERQRLTRARFDRFFVNRSACRIVMEACGSAHHHARRLSSQGHDVVLLPAQYARAYVRRNKTDAADAAALIDASTSCGAACASSGSASQWARSARSKSCATRYPTATAPYPPCCTRA
jgi:transposase